MSDPYRCPFCGEAFVVPSLTRHHIRKHHPKEEHG